MSLGINIFPAKSKWQMVLVINFKTFKIITFYSELNCLPLSKFSVFLKVKKKKLTLYYLFIFV